ncbi:LysR family transcriptional regulator [Loigolactobacillus backii]|uniref:LysR family transcriptional regulator n=1 Tax=Loigolactobacillus backii TaxID=375175 RepID=UPI0007F0A99A|nr:LysR family transcriptional regulator [Loigolactobacillus backii]ANK65426.1 LysR family transcriptional regulator [Loigolactobacillus backii]MDA5386847.1 LysR family transcriptional regulator [Loigolactobacillus backii]MDA5389368.1 LysR family transcriptional regulator [Loigolactobacillus backii]
MNLRHLIFFRELAHTQYMAKAAENLNISQPSLSYAISHLEQELGAPLFEKDGRNIKLTSFGKIYLEFVQRGLTELDHGQALIGQLLNVNEGHIHLGFTYTLGQRLVPELVTEFQKDQANQQITFSFAQGNTVQLLTDLLDEQYDFVLSSYVAAIGDQNLRNKLTFTPIVQQEIVLAVPNDHPLASRTTVSLNEIQNYPLIYFSKNSGLRPLLDNLLKTANVKPNIRCEIEEDHTIIGFVQYGYGIALVPNLPQLDHSLVHIVHIKESSATHQIYLVLKNNHFSPPSSSRFQNFVENYCQKNFTAKKRLI